MQINKFI